MILLLDLLNLAVCLPFLSVNEADIGRNVNQLKKYDWFQNLLQNPQKRELIIYNKQVRESIGKLNTSKLDRTGYNEKSRRKINQVLLNAA